MYLIVVGVFNLVIAGLFYGDVHLVLTVLNLAAGVACLTIGLKETS